VLARSDQLSRNPDVQAKLEADRLGSDRRGRGAQMSAHRYGFEVKKPTLPLGEVAGSDHASSTADDGDTPRGKGEDFERSWH